MECRRPCIRFSSTRCIGSGKANRWQESGTQWCEEVGFEEVSGVQRRDDEVVGCRQPVSDCGESGMDAGEEGTRCQGVTGSWHLMGGGSGE